MYTLRPARRSAARPVFVIAALTVCSATLFVANVATAQSSQRVIHELGPATDRIELTANTSRILTLQNKFATVQVSNPDVIKPTPISANQLSILAGQAGVTQLNLWDENGEVYTVDVIVYGDVQELQMALTREFPNASVQVRRYSGSLILTGFVESPDDVVTIQMLAEDYATKVINNIKVGGVHQIQLNVQVMEVSRTKLRELAVDWGVTNGSDFLISSVSGLIGAIPAASAATTGATIDFGIVENATTLNGVINALRQYDLAKILAEPKLVTTSGRPASFNVGGEFPILVPQSLGTVSVEYRSFGTEIDFLPLLLGNGNIRLEVRPRVSEIDSTRNVTIEELTVPGLRVRQVDTAVEMKAGQTLALAGLVQSRIEAQNKGLPFFADLPLVGVAFRSVKEEINEIELLILVRPELVDGVAPHEVPPGGPGTDTCSPSDHDLYHKGFLEVSCDEYCPGGCECQSCKRHSSYGPPVSSPLGNGNGEVIAPGVPQAQSFSNPYLGATNTGAGRTVVVSDQPVAPTPPTRPAAVTNNLHQPVATGDSSFRSSRRNASTPGLVGPVGYDVKR